MTMDTQTRIKMVLVGEKSSITDIESRLMERYPEDNIKPRSIRNKLDKGTIRFDEVQKMMDILGYDVIIRNRQTGREF